MRFQLSDLWRWDGTVGRGKYAVIGVVGFALKHNLDRLLATHLFGRQWGVFNYWIPPERIFPLSGLPAADAQFLLWMVLLAVPFIWVGVVLTMRRLRDLGWPIAMVLLFFFPFVNLGFFLLLALLPGREEGLSTQEELRDPNRYLARLLPDNTLGAAALAAVLTAVPGVLLTWLSVEWLEYYGWTLFAGVPFMQGFMAALLYGFHRPRRLREAQLVALLSQLVTGLLLFALLIEGVICLWMAMPIAVLLALMGGSAAWLIQTRPGARTHTAGTIATLLMLTPMVMAAERAIAPPHPLLEVSTVIEIDAAPEAVWQEVIAFSEIPEPEGWLFQLGFAYPLRAEMHGEGVGAVRHCVFSTGAFVEPIEVWDAPRRLKFGVTHNPPAMAEWNPLGDIRPPHVEGYLVSKAGQFLLTPLPGDRTRLEGTTWYHHSMRPAAYWQLWSDFVIHQIHSRVLEHIKQKVESGAIHSYRSATIGSTRVARRAGT